MFGFIAVTIPERRKPKSVQNARFDNAFCKNSTVTEKRRWKFKAIAGTLTDSAGPAQTLRVKLVPAFLMLFQKLQHLLVGLGGDGGVVAAKAVSAAGDGNEFVVHAFGS